MLRIIEILILVVLPLLLLYLKSSWPIKEIIINMTILPLIWYIFYAPLHELGHILGCFIAGTDITDYQLFAHFWEGNFGFAFVEIKGGYGENMNSFIILVLPYVLDVISIVLGFYLLTRIKIQNSFLFGLVFLIFNIRPLYDLLDNYIGYYLNHSDFVLAGKIAGNVIVFTFLAISIMVGITLILVLLIKYKPHPEKIRRFI